MIFQILIYGLFISKIKDQKFAVGFFFFEVYAVLKKKKKGPGSSEGVQICITGVQKKKFNIIYIYIYIILGQEVHLNPLTTT